MNQPAIQWVQPGGATRQRTAGGRSDLAFLVRNYKSGTPEKRQPQGVITIYPSTMKALRWQVGDRVMVGLSPDQRDIYIKRVQVGGYALSALGGDKNKKKTGTTCSASIKSNQINFITTAEIKPSDYIVMDDGTVMFSLPAKEAA